MVKRLTGFDQLEKVPYVDYASTTTCCATGTCSRSALTPDLDATQEHKPKEIASPFKASLNVPSL